jgi:hypothetical protein
MSDPWRGGTDPILRWLRAITVIVCLGVFAFLAVDRNSGADRLPALALAITCVLMLEGYARFSDLPLVGRKRDDDD